MKLFKVLKQPGDSVRRDLSHSQMLAGLIEGHSEMISAPGRGSIFRLVISEK